MGLLKKNKKKEEQENIQFIDVEPELHGDFDYCYTVIKEHYDNSNKSLDSFLLYFKCVDLTMQQQLELIAKLKDNLEEQLIVDIVNKDMIKILSSDKDNEHTDLKNLNDMIKEM